MREPATLAIAKAENVANMILTARINHGLANKSLKRCGMHGSILFTLLEDILTQRAALYLHNGISNLNWHNPDLGPCANNIHKFCTPERYNLISNNFRTYFYAAFLTDSATTIICPDMQDIHETPFIYFVVYIK